MTDTTQQIFDRALLQRRRARAVGEIASRDFLLERVGEDMAERLQTIQRTFPLAVELGAHHGPVGAAIAPHAGIETLVQADSCMELASRCSGLRVVCDEEYVPFAEASLDLIISSLSLHMVNDLPGALIQMRRALKPDGLLLAALPGGQTLFELRHVLGMAEAEIDGGMSPRVSPFADIRDLGALLQRAGFALPVTDVDIVTVTYENIFALMHELRGMGMTNVLHERRRTPLKRSVLMRAAELYSEHFPAGDGRISATFEIIHLSGWAPHDSQQKPLAPGSASKRLADALDTVEHSAGEKAGPAQGKKK